jgi:hypothetical protein
MALHDTACPFLLGNLNNKLFLQRQLLPYITLMYLIKTSPGYILDTITVAFPLLWELSSAHISDVIHHCFAYRFNSNGIPVHRMAVM